jgi:twinkle protein
MNLVSELKIGSKKAFFLENSVSLKLRINKCRNYSTDTNTFVSSHYKFDPSTIKSYLARKQFNDIRSSPGSNQILIKVCPFCPDTKDKPDNLWKLNINTVSGVYNCYRCGQHGSWFDFQNKLGDIKTIQSNKSTETKPAEAKAQATIKQKLSTSIANLKKFPEVMEFLKKRGFNEKTIADYQVGAGNYRFMQEDEKLKKDTPWVDCKCVTFPWLRKKGNNDNNNENNNENDAQPSTTENETKITTENNRLNINENENSTTSTTTSSPSSTDSSLAPITKEEPEWELFRIKYRPITFKTFRLDPNGGSWGLFGWHLIPDNAKEIIITEGEFDAMAVYQATGRPAVSLPNGASSLPIEIVEMLEPFRKIIFWMDNDVRGREGAEKFANKLGLGRCMFVEMGVKSNAKDANDALKMGLDLKKLLEKAAPIPHKQIISFAELRDQIFLEMSTPHESIGVQSTSFPTLNKLLGGHRKGELTILTGSTGIGKTSIISQLSIDYCSQGINTLWGSFEIQNTRLAKKMLTQFACKNLEKNIHEFKFYADKFSELPLYFMKFYGTTVLDHVIDTMEYATYAHDVEHIVLDNLQFMMGSQKGFEKFDKLDEAIERLRKFSTSKQVHITLVIHPRKELDGMPLTIQSVFGSAKATQEADNVFIVQQDSDGNRSIEIAKNRFSGKTGKINYRYDQDTFKYFELTQYEMEGLKISNNPTPPRKPWVNYKKPFNNE